MYPGALNHEPLSWVVRGPQECMNRYLYRTIRENSKLPMVHVKPCNLNAYTLNPQEPECSQPCTMMLRRIFSCEHAELHSIGIEGFGVSS